MDYHFPKTESPIQARSKIQWTLVCLLGIAILFGSGYFRNLLYEVDLTKRLQTQERAVLLEANAIRYRLEAETLSSFYLVASLGAYISTNPNLTQDEYQEFTRSIFEARPGLVNIAAAPDMVIRYIYPKRGNEAVIGFDYNKDLIQGAAALAVKDGGKPVIAGPLELIQGGVAVIGRFPVYTDDGFWGIVSTPIFLERLLRDSGLLDETLSIEVALRGKDSKGPQGGIFWGDPEMFSGNTLKIPIQLFSGSWQLAVRPKFGWASEAPNGFLIDLFVWFAGGLVVLILVLLNVYVLKLEKSREIEASVSRAKSRFLAIMSHEIRTPLNGILGIAHLLNLGELDEEQHELTSTIISSATALNSLLSDILNLSRLEYGTFVAHPETVALHEIFDPIVALLKVEAEAKSIALVFGGIPSDCETLELDPLVLRQVIWNLLGNAVKFTNKGEVRLEIELKCREGSYRRLLCIEIEDTGIGIDRSRHDAVFEEFVQEDDSTTREFGGTGLGLAIVKRLLARVGGKITLKSEKGKGCTFSVEIPIGS